MGATRFPLDRSVAFTILLEDPRFADTPDDGGATVSRFLADWYADPGLDMRAFARGWIAQGGLV